MIWPFKRKRTLAEYQPHELSMDLLTVLQHSLIAKLLLVNADLAKRCSALSTLATEVPGADAPGGTLAHGVERLIRLNAVLEEYLRAVRVQPPRVGT